VDHHQLADVLGGDQADEAPVVVDHGERGTAARLLRAIPIDQLIGPPMSIGY
jgi:hypothetical protein